MDGAARIGRISFDPFGRRAAAAEERAVRLEAEQGRLAAALEASGGAVLQWAGPGEPSLPALGAAPPAVAAGQRLTRDQVVELAAPGARTRLRDALDALRGRGEGFEEAVEAADGRSLLLCRGSRKRAGEGAIDSLWLCLTGHPAPDPREVQARLLAVLDRLPVAVWCRNPDLSIHAGNAAWLRAVEAGDHDEALARGAEILTARGRQIAEEARARGEPVTERHHTVIAGARRLVEVTELPPDGQGGVSQGFALDHTETEEAEAEVGRLIGAHRAVLENLGTAIAMFGADRRLAFFNQAYVRLWGLDEPWLQSGPDLGEVLEVLRERRQLTEFADFPAYKRGRMKLFTSLLAPAEELMHLPDGRTLRMIVSPHPTGGLLYTFEDVTDRLALERSYNTLIEVQRETLDNLYEGVAVFGPDGRLKLSNPAYARVWGLSDDFLGTEPHLTDLIDRVRGFFDYGDELAWARVRERILARAVDRLPANGQLERMDGSVLNYAKVPLPDGAVMWSYVDITDSIRVERALRERNEALETADRLKSEFIANVSYELRTPLNAIIGFAEILDNEYFGPLNDRQKEYSRGIVEASGRLLSLINDILDLALIEAGHMTLERSNVDVHALTASVFNLTRDWARKQNISLEFDCPPETGEMLGDERRLKQALFNLVSNAIKFTPPGGTILLGARREGRDIVFVVSDTGIGVASEDHGRIFEKFERGRGPEGRHAGVGLGLSLVKNFVELHGGRVEIQSDRGAGTRIVCTVPAQAG